MSALEKSFEKELAACLFFFFCFYVGAEMVFSNFIYSFGICHLQMSRDRATMLTSLFWLFFTIFRFLSAVQARYMKPKTMLWTSLFGCLITTTIMLITKIETIIYICVAIFGGSMSNCFATGFLYAQNFLEVSGKLASIFVFGGGLGWAGMPTVAGFVLEG